MVTGIGVIATKQGRGVIRTCEGRIRAGQGF